MQCLSKNQKAALAEISDVLQAVCHAHRLPLALTWIPCCYIEGVDDKIIKVWVRDRTQILMRIVYCALRKQLVM